MVEKIRQSNQEKGVICAVLLLTVAETTHAFGNMQVPGDLERAVQMEPRRRKLGWMDQGERNREHLRKWEIDELGLFKLLNNWCSTCADPSE